MSPGGGQPNPVCMCHEYRTHIFAAARSLQTLDGSAADASKGTASAAAAATAALGAVPPTLPDGNEGRLHRGEVAVATGEVKNTRADNDQYVTNGGVSGGVGGGSGLGSSQVWTVAAAAVAPEDVPMPRFDAVAGRFRRRRRRGQTRLEVSGDGEVSSGVVSPASVDESVSDTWGEGGEGARQEGYDTDRSVEGLGTHPEETAGRSVGRGVGGKRERGRGGGSAGYVDRELLGVRAGAGEDVAEEQGLLSRLRSIAQEARLEVMDSRLQDLHVGVCSLGEGIWRVVWAPDFVQDFDWIVVGSVCVSTAKAAQ